MHAAGHNARRETGSPHSLGWMKNPVEPRPAWLVLGTPIIEGRHMTIRTYWLTLALLMTAVCTHASDAGPATSQPSAAYRCEGNAHMTVIATTADFSSSVRRPDKDGYQHAQAGRQTFRCEGGPEVSVEVLPPQATGECGGDGRVIITDITFPGWRKGTELIEFNKRCFFSDYITKLEITRHDKHYSVKRCSDRNMLNKQAFIGCTTTSMAKEPATPPAR